MRVLSVVWFKVLPAKYGGQKGTAFFNAHLAAYVDLTCLCSKNNIAEDALPYKFVPELPVSKLQFLNPFCWLQIVREAKKTHAEVLLLEYPYHAIGCFLATRLLKIPLVLHEHNIEYQRFRKLKKQGWNVLFLLERWIAQQAKLVLFKTEKDRRFAIQAFNIQTHKCIVVPYGVLKKMPSATQTDVRARYSILPEAKIILFAGTLDYEPNAVAVTNIYQYLIPQLQESGQLFQILICGRLKEKAFQYLKSFQHPKVIFIGEVEDIAPYFEASDVFIDPVLYNGGIQTKILDALSYHCNVVAFENAVQGFNSALAPEKIACVANEDWNGFAAAIQKMSNQKKKTPDAFFEQYNWNTITENVYQRLKELV